MSKRMNKPDVSPLFFVPVGKYLQKRTENIYDYYVEYDTGTQNS